MKKIFALLLAAVMCVCAFASCTKAPAGNENEVIALSLEQIEADPAAAIKNSINEQPKNGIYKTFENIESLENIHVTTKLAGMFDLELWASQKEEASGFEVAISDKTVGNDYLARLTNKELVVGIGNDVFGIPLDNLKKDFENAKFWEFCGMTVEDFYTLLEEAMGMNVDELIESLAAFAEEIQRYDAEADEAFMSVIESAKVKVEEQKVATQDGELDAIVIDYTIDTDLLEEVSYWYLDFLEQNPFAEYMAIFSGEYAYDYSEVISTYEEAFDEIIMAFDENIDSMNFKYVINSASGKLALVKLEFKSETLEGDPDAVYCMEFDLGKDYMTSDKFVFSIYTLRGGEKEMNASLAVTAKEGEKDYSLTATYCEYQDGELSSEVDLLVFEMDFEENKYKLSSFGSVLAKGNFEIREGYVSFDIDGLGISIAAEYGESSFGLEVESEQGDLSFTIDEEKFPAAREYKNIFQMNENEFLALGEVFAEAFGGADEFDAELSEEIVDYYTSTPEGLDEYVEMISSQTEELESDLFTMSIYSRGNSIVFEYRYTVDVGDIDTVAEAINASFDGLEGTVSENLSQMCEESGIDIYSLIYEYYTEDGELIAMREFA